MDQVNVLPVSTMVVLAGFALIVGVPLVLAIRAVILRIACSSAAVPVPGFLKAMGVSFIVMIVELTLRVAFDGGAGYLAVASGLVDRESLVDIETPLWLTFLPIWATVTAGLYVTLLKVSFGKGLQLWLIQLILMFMIVLIGAAIFFLTVIVRAVLI